MDSLLSEYEQFVRARTPALLRCAYLLTGDQQLAEDLVQEALARTHRAWRRIREEANAEAYTRKIIYRLQASIWRRRRVKESLPGVLPEASGPTDHAHDVAVRVALQRALATLSAGQRAVIVLRYFEDCTEVEAAEVLGVAVGTVKAHAFRAIQRLRRAAPELSELMTTDGVDR